jgi:hypothetical protein
MIFHFELPTFQGGRLPTAWSSGRTGKEKTQGTQGKPFVRLCMFSLGAISYSGRPPHLHN